MSAVYLRARLHAFAAGHQLQQHLLAPAAAAVLTPAVDTICSGVSSLVVSRPILQVSPISTSATSYLKEIEKRVEGNTTIVEGKYVESPRTGKLVFNPHAEEKVCPLCALNLNLKHTDVLILSQFVRPDGRLLPRRVTGLCCSQQYKLTRLVTMAKKAGLMPNLAPANSHKDPAKRRGSKKLNRFFDEATIGDTRLVNVALYREIRYTK